MRPYKPRLPGKKFDEWMVRVNDSKRVPVLIRAEQHSGSLANYTYYGFCDDPKMKWEANTLADLRDQIDADFKEYFSFEWKPTLIVMVDDGYRENYEDRYPKGLLSPEVKWEDFEMVSTDKPMLSKVSATLKVSVDPCYLADTGETENDERVYQRRDTHKDTSTTTWNHSRRGEDKYTLLPDTPENREALQQIVDGVKRLHDRLEDLLSQKKIGHTLKMIHANGIKLLPAKEEK